jgi:hypothetical protein
MQATNRFIFFYLLQVTRVDFSLKRKPLASRHCLSVRRLIKPTWLNDRDQFLQPKLPLEPVFETDCLVWMLFNGSNLTAGANDLEWNGKKWSLVNHFIPFTEAEVGAPDRFESDFMVVFETVEK